MSAEIQGHLFCPHCGYDLTGLSGERCPECGGEFDLLELHRAARDPFTFGAAIVQLLWLPGLTAVAGAVLSPVMATWNVPVLVNVGVIIIGLATFVVVGLHYSHMLAREMGVRRARARCIAFKERQVIGLSLGLFFCQAILSVAAYVGGCACGLSFWLS